MNRIIIFVLLIYLPFSTCAGTIEICPSCEIQSLENGYLLCEKGDTLLIKGGTYEIDPFVIDKQISIIGEDHPNIQSLSGDALLIITADNVTIKNLTFSGVTTNYLKENAAVRIRRAKNFKIQQNHFENCFFSIYLERGKNGIIHGNTINGNAQREAESGNGIHAWYCDSLIISHNDIAGQRDGIYFEFVNNSTIQNNVSHDNIRYGLHFMFSNDDRYEDNRFERNGVGVAVMFSRRITMQNNKFLYNWGNAAYGLLLKEIYDAEIADNVFAENTVGIFVEGSNRINYLRNDFKRNGWAIKFSGGCDANTISENNFLYNSLDMLVSTKLQNNSIDGNYWSEYAGYDLDKDGRGDIPYYPVKLYSYILNQVPESVVLMRSLFVDLVNFAEKVSPVFTPKDVFDSSPKMNLNK